MHQTEENIDFEGKINEQSLALDILSLKTDFIKVCKIFFFINKSQDLCNLT